MEKLGTIEMKRLFIVLYSFIMAILCNGQNISLSQRITFSDISDISNSDMSDLDIAPISSTKENSHIYALIVANENYKRVPKVPYALNDGNSIYRYVHALMGVPENNIQHIEDASLNDIKYALSNIKQRCNAFPNELSVIIYYAGHGIPDEKTSEAYLLPIDGYGTDPSSGLKLSNLYSELNQMSAKSVIVLVDACFSGIRRDGGMLMATRGITIKPKSAVPDGKLIALSATSDDEAAFPIEKQKHGLFTYTLLQIMYETNGNITWGELADSVIEKVKHKSIDLNGKLQTPSIAVSPSLQNDWRNWKLK